MKIPSPHQVNLMQSEIAMAVLDEITNKLLHREWVKNNKCGTEADPYWIFSKQGVVTDEDKALIAKELTSVGWNRVIVKNSAELEQPDKLKPGIIKVAIFVNAISPEALKKIEGMIQQHVRTGEDLSQKTGSDHRSFFRPRN